MVIVSEMGTGRTCSEEPGCYGEIYGDAVSNADWAAPLRVEARLEEVVVAARREPAKADSEGFMAHLCLCQE